jgi:hypothetical protein
MEQAKAWLRAVCGTLRDGGVPPENVSVGICLDRWPYVGDGKFQGGTLFQEWAKCIAGETWGEPAAFRVQLPVHQVAANPGEWRLNDNIWRSAPELVFGQMYHEANYFWGDNATPRVKILSNDGNDPKDTPESIDLWRRMVESNVRDSVYHHPQVGYRTIFEYLSDSSELPVHQAGMRATVAGLCAGLGKPPEQVLVNYHRKAYVAPGPEIPDPPPDETPTTPTVPIDPPFNWIGFWRNRWGWIKNHPRAIGVGLIILILLKFVIC